MEHFFPRIQVETCGQMKTRVKLLGGLQMWTILKLLGKYSQIIGGIYPPIPPPPPPGFGTPGSQSHKSGFEVMVVFQHVRLALDRFVAVA